MSRFKEALESFDGYKDDALKATDILAVEMRMGDAIYKGCVDDTVKDFDTIRLALTIAEMLKAGEPSYGVGMNMARELNFEHDTGQITNTFKAMSTQLIKEAEAKVK